MGRRVDMKLEPTELEHDQREAGKKQGNGKRKAQLNLEKKKTEAFPLIGNDDTSYGPTSGVWFPLKRRHLVFVAFM